MRLVTAAEMRTLDRLTIAGGTPGHVLMERAGAGATQVLLQTVPRLRRGGRVLVVAGKGNNGGDGFVIARLLRARGVRVEVALLARADEVGGDALRTLRAWTRGRGKIVEVTTADDLGRLATAVGRADVIVDAIFGTGLSSAVRGLAAEVIELINAAGAPVFAVDIPSGLDADTGIAQGAVIQAEATATFGFAKLGQVQYPGARLCGTLAVVDIGISEEAIATEPARAALLEAADAARLVPRRHAEAHKGDCGHVLILAGSFGRTGAAHLAARGAGRAGAGLVTLVAPASLYPVFAAGVREAMTATLPDDDGRIRFDASALAALLAGKSAVVAGPGLGTHEGAARTVRWLLEQAEVPLVLDADALTIVAREPAVLRAARTPLVLTPHPGEMARLLGGDTAAVQGDRAGVARRFADAHRCTVLLKGARTVIAEPSGFVWVNPTGNPGMASGGMGDVLAGVIGALLAQGLTAPEAACLGAYVHGFAADRIAHDGGAIGLLATDVADALRPALHALVAEPA